MRRNIQTTPVICRPEVGPNNTVLISMRIAAPCFISHTKRKRFGASRFGDWRDREQYECSFGLSITSLTTNAGMATAQGSHLLVTIFFHAKWNLKQKDLM